MSNLPDRHSLRCHKNRLLCTKYYNFPVAKIVKCKIVKLGVWELYTVWAPYPYRLEALL